METELGYKPQVLLDQAISCIDATLVEVAKERNYLMSAGISAYTIGSCLHKLAEASGELATVKRMLPGWTRGERDE